MDIEEKLLIQKIQQWDYDSFTQLYESYFKKIYSFCLIKSNGNISMAEDITSETFIKALENINKFDTERENSSFSARLYKIAYRKLIDAIKIQKSDSIQNEDITSLNSDYLDYIQNNVQVEQILAYLLELWPDKKDLFTLRVRDNLSYNEIWQILWKNSASCRKEFSRLVKTIANKFKYWLDD